MALSEPGPVRVLTNVLQKTAGQQPGYFLVGIFVREAVNDTGFDP